MIGIKSTASAPFGATHSHTNNSDGVTTFFKKCKGTWLQCKQFDLVWFDFGVNLDGNSLLTSL